MRVMNNKKNFHWLRTPSVFYTNLLLQVWLIEVICQDISQMAGKQLDKEDIKN